MGSKAMLLIYMVMLGVSRGSGKGPLRAGTLNALAVSKATVTVGGFPNFNMDGFNKHNKLEEYGSNDAKGNAIMYGKWLVDVLDEVMFSKLDMLVLQEIDKPFYYSLLHWKEKETKKGTGATIKIYDAKGSELPQAAPLAKGDGLYVILASKTWDMTCLPQVGGWTPEVTSTNGGKTGKVLACTLSCTGLMPVRALFMHGDSDWKALPDNLPKALPNRADLKEKNLPGKEKNRDFDLIMGDWNVDNKKNVTSMVKGMVDNKHGKENPIKYTVLPNMYRERETPDAPWREASTLIRDEYEFRKIAQQYENACSLAKGSSLVEGNEVAAPTPTLFAELCPSKGTDECTCIFLKENILGTTCKGNIEGCEACQDYANLHKKINTTASPEIQTAKKEEYATFKKDCDTLKKICDRVKKCTKPPNEWTRFAAKFEQEQNWCSQTYDWRGWTETWSEAELTSEKDKTHDIAPCKIGYASGQALHPKAGEPHFAVEDWIVIRKTADLKAERTIVHEYAAIKEAAEGGDAPTAVWPSDHLLVYTNIEVGQDVFERLYKTPIGHVKAKNGNKTGKVGIRTGIKHRVRKVLRKLLRSVFAKS